VLPSVRSVAWAVKFGGSLNDYVYGKAIAVDASTGHAFVTGGFYSSSITFGYVAGSYVGEGGRSDVGEGGGVDEGLSRPIFASFSLYQPSTVRPFQSSRGQRMDSQVRMGRAFADWQLLFILRFPLRQQDDTPCGKYQSPVRRLMIVSLW
jgi:hypothetical protein